MGSRASDLHADGAHREILCVPGTVAGGNVLGDPLLKMDGPAVFKLAVNVLEASARAVLHSAGRSEADIDWLIPHQANIRIMQGTARKLKLPPEKLVATVQTPGCPSTPLSCASSATASATICAERIAKRWSAWIPVGERLLSATHRRFILPASGSRA